MGRKWRATGADIARDLSAVYWGALRNIYVGNISWSASDEQLRELFAAFGSVSSARVITDRETGRSRGFGFVEMEDGAGEAIAELNGHEMDSRP
ncbi:MAG: RNA-binding protein [Pseudomonadales bacterium]|nr:RNA-binding protein [Pseudomonadales bacterium]